MNRHTLDLLSSIASAILTALIIGGFLYSLYYVATEDIFTREALVIDDPREAIKESELVDVEDVEEQLNRMAREKRLEEERIAKEKAEAEQRERERIERERLEQERIAQEKARLEQEKIEREAQRIAAEKAEKKRIEEEKRAQEREKQAAIEREKLEKEKALAEEKARKARAEKEEQERIAREKAEKAEQERIAKERAEQERKAQEAAALKKQIDTEVDQWLYVAKDHAEAATSYSAYLSASDNLYAEILIQLDLSGNIKNMKIIGPSGDPQYDAEALRVLSIVNRFPMPESDKAKQRVVNEGLKIVVGTGP